MKIGIATTNDQVYPVQLFYYLLKNSIKPEFVIVVKKTFIQRIARNLNLASILGLLKSKRSEARHTRIFVIRKNTVIDVKEIFKVRLVLAGRICNTEPDFRQLRSMV